MGNTIDSIDEQIKRLKQRKASMVAKRNKRRRRLDARCKILVGSHLKKLADADDEEAATVYQRVIADLREDERSRKTLDDLEALDREVAAETSRRTNSVETEASAGTAEEGTHD